MQRVVWVVAHVQGLEIVDTNVFDNESDAATYAGEMTAGNNEKYQIIKSVFNSRDDVEKEASQWVSLPEFDAECLECLVLGEGDPIEEKYDEGVCINFLEENKEKLQEKADELVHEYIRKELRDYINDERVILG